MRARLAMVVALAAALTLASVAAGGHAATKQRVSIKMKILTPAAAGATDVAVQFVTAANRGDFRTVCRLYSARYVRSQATCVSLYRWGAGLYGPFDYTIVRWRTLKNGHRRVDLTRWQHPSFIELEREKTGWRIVAGGW
jgi:hypothetical protein